MHSMNLVTFSNKDFIFVLICCNTGTYWRKYRRWRHFLSVHQVSIADMIYVTGLKSFWRKRLQLRIQTKSLNIGPASILIASHRVGEDKESISALNVFFKVHVLGRKHFLFNGINRNTLWILPLLIWQKFQTHI